jgi:outer membrane protein assembly factor BamB
MPRKSLQHLYIGASGKVLALDANTGAEIWRTRLKSSGTVLLLRDDTHLYASVSGELFCLDPANGAIRWHNKLKGLGLGLVSMATTQEADKKSTAYVPIAEQLRQNTHAHGAA